MPRRPDPRIEQSRTLVLEAATALFCEHGLRGITVDGAAARSGVARSTIYRHWTNRDALVADVLRSFQFTIDVPDRDLPVDERFKAVARQLAAVLADSRYRQILPTLIDPANNDRQEILRILGPAHHSQQRALSTLVRDAVDDGHLPDDTDAREVVLQILGPLTITALVDPASADAHLADRMVDLMLASRGVRRSRTRSRRSTT